VVISQWLPNGSLFRLLHEETGGLVVDNAQAIRFALGVARGMAFLHSIERITPQFHLNSCHVMVGSTFDTYKLLIFYFMLQFVAKQ